MSEASAINAETQKRRKKERNRGFHLREPPGELIKSLMSFLGSLASKSSN